MLSQATIGMARFTLIDLVPVTQDVAKMRVEMPALMSASVLPDDTYLKIDSSELDDRTLDVRCMMTRFSLLARLA